VITNGENKKQFTHIAKIDQTTIEFHKKDCESFLNEKETLVFASVRGKKLSLFTV
jgi:hypothetical protein